MRSTVGRVGGGAFVALWFLALFAAVRMFRQITPLPERADVPGGFAVLFVTLLFLVGLGLLAVGTALLVTPGRPAGARYRRGRRRVPGRRRVNGAANPASGRCESGLGRRRAVSPDRGSGGSYPVRTHSEP
jgi:hypothetical protein